MKKLLFIFAFIFIFSFAFACGEKEDEKKQDDMRHHLQAQYPEVAGKVKFYIGDVRNRESVNVAMRGVDYVFAAAALKQVPSCEFFPMEATQTNVIGTHNVLLSAVEYAWS